MAFENANRGCCFFCQAPLPEPHRHEHAPGGNPVCHCGACEVTTVAWGYALLRVGALETLKGWNVEGVRIN